MVLYIAAFILAALMLTLFNYTGYVYLTVAVCIGLAWLGLGLRGFKSTNDTLWGRQMFRLSLLLITAICVVIPFDTNMSNPPGGSVGDLAKSSIKANFPNP